MRREQLDDYIIRHLSDRATMLHKHFSQGDSGTVQLLMAENTEMAQCADDPDYKWLTIPLNFGMKKSDYIAHKKAQYRPEDDTVEPTELW